MLENAARRPYGWQSRPSEVRFVERFDLVELHVLKLLAY